MEAAHAADGPMLRRRNARLEHSIDTVMNKYLGAHTCANRNHRKQVEEEAKDLAWIKKNVLEGRQFIIDEALINHDIDPYYEAAVNLESQEDKVIAERHKKCL